MSSDPDYGHAFAPLQVNRRNGRHHRLAVANLEVQRQRGLQCHRTAAAGFHPFDRDGLGLRHVKIDAGNVGQVVERDIGLSRVARYYYYPGWWEGSAQLSLYCNAKAWRALPPDLKGMFELAAQSAHAGIQARYDVLNPIALKQVVAAGVRVKAFPKSVLDARLAEMLTDSAARADWRANALAFAETADIYSNAERAADLILEGPR